MSERAHFVLMRDQGMTPVQIADAMTYEVRTVRRWLKRFDADGIAGLYDQPKTGRPALEPHLTDVVETQAGQPPTVYGYLQTVWTVALLTLHVFTRFKARRQLQHRAAGAARDWVQLASPQAHPGTHT
ncbi:MAG: helix-turn-helix domain-containing protein [Candidatus Brachytrichaceae bacterium NZ_4S206]|jgi:transposase